MNNMESTANDRDAALYHYKSSNTGFDKNQAEYAHQLTRKIKK